MLLKTGCGNAVSSTPYSHSISTIEICQYSYAVYYAFLKYLYTDNVDSVTVEDAVGECLFRPVQMNGYIIIIMYA